MSNKTSTIDLLKFEHIRLIKYYISIKFLMYNAKANIENKSYGEIISKKNDLNELISSIQKIQIRVAQLSEIEKSCLVSKRIIESIEFLIDIIKSDQLELKCPVKSSYWLIPGLILVGESLSIKDDENISNIHKLINSGVNNIIYFDKAIEENYDAAILNEFDTKNELEKQDNIERIQFKRFSLLNYDKACKNIILESINFVMSEIENGNAVYLYSEESGGKKEIFVACLLLFLKTCRPSEVIDFVKYLISNHVHSQNSYKLNYEQSEFILNWKND